MKLDQFEVKDSTPIEALNQLVQIMKQTHGEMVEITVSEFAKDLPLERKLGAHRRISFMLKGTTFGEAFVTILNAARWHWRITDDKYIVYAWHKVSD